MERVLDTLFLYMEFKEEWKKGHDSITPGPGPHTSMSCTYTHHRKQLSLRLLKHCVRVWDTNFQLTDWPTIWYLSSMISTTRNCISWRGNIYMWNMEVYDVCIVSYMILISTTVNWCFSALFPELYCLPDSWQVSEINKSHQHTLDTSFNFSNTFMHKSYEAYLQLNLRILIYASLVRICI